MHRSRPALAVLVLATFALLAAPALAAALVDPHADDTAASTIDPTAALGDLNALRRRVGVRDVQVLLPAASLGCRHHNIYMYFNGFGHDENPAGSHYTADGASAGTASVLASPAALPAAAWTDAVYHRLALLEPRLVSTGYDAFDGFACLRVADHLTAPPRHHLKLYPWPAAGQRNVPRAFTGPEAPSPSADAHGDRTLGVLISVNVDGPWTHPTAASTTLRRVTLRGRGRPVPVSLTQRGTANAAWAHGGFVIIPRRRLAAGTWYTVRVKGTVRAGSHRYRFTRHWRFRTAA